MNFRREFDVVVQGVGGMQDFWIGDSANAARDRAANISGQAGKLARAQVAAAVAARDGAGQIAAARDEVLSEVVAAESLGFAVADDGTVNPPPQPPPYLLTMCRNDVELARRLLQSSAMELTDKITALLQAVGAADDDAAHDIEEAFGDVTTPAPTVKTDAGDPAANWPTMSQHDIGVQISGLTPEQRRQLLEKHPREVGNTDGVPWDMRIAANRTNIEQAILDQRGYLQRTQDLTQRKKITERIALYQDLLREVADPTGKPGQVDRKILAFDPEHSSLIELFGDVDTAENIGVLVPGMNTTIEGSAENAATAERFVAAARGDLAMITYIGGPFPQGGIPDGIDDAMDPHYATDMAPRLVAFSEDVNRVADAAGRDVGVTYVGHSYGGSILGTAESMGLTADRTVYVEAAGAGVGVDEPGDWHNDNRNVMRYSMTAPGDWIEPLQGLLVNPHGADPDTMPGVIRLATGDYDDGRTMAGAHSHTAVLNEPSDAWRNILAVMTNTPISVYAQPRQFWPPWWRLTG
ncbi:MAG: hypothetical protein QOH57_1657 [Mycobacterium sp.]|nr:hypothetical protein [Mycobacterium sp.]